MALHTGPFADQGEGAGGSDQGLRSGSDGRGRAEAVADPGTRTGTGDAGGPDPTGIRGLTDRTRQWLNSPLPIASATPPMVRRLGVLWVCVSLPVISAISGFVVDSRDSYIFVLIFMGCGAYTLPGLFAARHAVRWARDGDRPGFSLIGGGLLAVFLIGCGMFYGIVTGWNGLNFLGVPAVCVAGSLHIWGLTVLVRQRSGYRALSVDIIEAVGSVIAVAAPMVVLWGPAVVGAEESWYTIPAAVIVLFMITGTYWVALLWVRIGPGPRGVFEVAAIVLALVGAFNGILQTAQGISGFTLPTVPLIALCAFCASSYLLIPLHVPLMLRRGLDQLPPQAQIRGGWLPTVVPLCGLGALLGATLWVHDERPWAVPFSLGVVSLLVVLAGLRQMEALRETRRLYSRVEEASDERRRLLTQLLERSVNDRRRFAEQLHEQAVVAYTSFSALTRAGRAAPVVAEASQLVRGDLGRHADSLRELVLSIRRPEDEAGAGIGAGSSGQGPRLLAPVQAYLATIYGDRRAPALSMRVDDELVLDWMVETLLLQIVQEALHNVWRHSDATEVDIVIEPTGPAHAQAVTVRITDDGVGFDPATTREGSGLPTMRASAGVVEGSFRVESRLGTGTTVTARLGPTDDDDIPFPYAPPSAPPSFSSSDPSSPPVLRLIRTTATDD
jgi:signal transduction histidine kinase